MAKSNEERLRFAHDEILGKGNLNVVDEIFATDYGAGNVPAQNTYPSRYLPQ